MFSFGMMCDPGQADGEYARIGEERGFEYHYVLDSPIIWPEMLPYMTQAVTKTSTTKVGACVTNPVTRNIAVSASAHATLQKLSGGRMILGLGKGDSAVRRMGERPPRLKEFKEKALLMHRLANGEEIAYTPETPAQEKWYEQGTGEVTLKFPWAIKKRIPLYIAGYGPKILRWVGEAADGIFLQIAEPSTIEWAIGHLRAGAESKGRSMRDIDVVCCTPSVVSDDVHEACNVVRGFVPAVSNHVLDMLRYYDRSELPLNLLRCLEQKVTYDYRHHGDSSSEMSAVIPDELVDSYTIVGSAQKCAEKLQQLREIGVTQLCVYFTKVSDADIRATIQAYADQIIPKLK